MTCLPWSGAADSLYNVPYHCSVWIPGYVSIQFHEQLGSVLPGAADSLYNVPYHCSVWIPGYVSIQFHEQLGSVLPGAAHSLYNVPYRCSVWIPGYVSIKFHDQLWSVSSGAAHSLYNVRYQCSVGFPGQKPSNYNMSTMISYFKMSLIIAVFGSLDRNLQITTCLPWSVMLKCPLSLQCLDPWICLFHCSVWIPGYVSIEFHDQLRSVSPGAADSLYTGLLSTVRLHCQVPLPSPL